MKTNLPKSFEIAGKRCWKRSDVELFKAQYIAEQTGAEVIEPPATVVESFVPIKTFASELGVSSRTILRWIEFGKIQPREP